MQQLSKLQIRAKVLYIISKIKALKYKNVEALHDFISELEVIEDKKTLFDIFLKEYYKLEEEDANFCACLLKESIPVEYISDKSIENLKSTSLSDEYKYKIVQLLRITGGNYNYADLPDYFENPQEIMDMETKRLLDSAVFNPESMLDFLDFVSAVSERDKSLLLKSLALDYKGDVLANIVYPVLYSDFSETFTLQAIDVLINSKSSLAVAPFEYVCRVSTNENLINACKKGLKLLKIAGAKKEKADEYFKNIVRTSSPAEYFVTIPDGSGQQALLSSRKHENGKYSIAAVVISDTSGIVDCFGFFNISDVEVIKIINKFYKSEGQYIVPSEYVKSRIDFAHKLNETKKYKFPYEYICWSPMFSDISPLNQTLEEYAKNNCKMQILSKINTIDIMAAEYTFRWFFTSSDNDFIKNLTNDIYNMENLDIQSINILLKDNVDNIFDSITTDIWKDRFYNLIYILRKNKKEKEADNFYTILNDEKLFDLFKQIIIQRSVFNSFIATKENAKESFLTKNIFRKRNSNQPRYNVKKLNSIIEMLKRGWLGG